MKTIWSNEVDEILNIGVPLDSIGIRNWALSKTQALSALEKLLVIQVPVLGGDVYEKIGETMRPNYDNWYCEKSVGESESDFISRSIDVAKVYVQRYGIAHQADKIFFVFVPDA